MIHSDILKQLPEESIINLIPGLMDIIYDHGKIAIYEKNALLFSENTILEELVIPLDCDLQLITKKMQGEDFSTVLSRGRTLALKAILDKTFLPYSVSAPEGGKILFLPLNIFFQTLDKYPDIRNYLFLMTHFSSFRSLIRFTENYFLPKNKQIYLAHNLELKHYDIEIINLCKTHLILVQSGKVLIESFDLTHFQKTTIEEGQWFGGEAIVPPYRHSYKIKSVENVHALIIPFAHLSEIGISEDLTKALYHEPFLDFEGDFHEEERTIEIKLLPGKIVKDLNHRDFIHFSYSLSDLIYSKYFKDSFSATVNTLSIIFNRPCNTRSIKNFMSIYQRNLSIGVLAESIEQIGLMTRPLRLEKDIFLKSKLPLLAYYNNRPILFLEKLKKDFYLIYDSVNGLYEVSFQKLISEMHGEDIEALEITDPEGFKKIHEMQRTKSVVKFLGGTDLSWSQLSLKSFLKDRFKILFRVFFLSFLIFLVNIVPPKIMEYVVDMVIPIKDYISLMTMLGLYIICQFSIMGLSWVKMQSLNSYSYFYDYELSSVYYSKILKIIKSKWKENRVGEVMASMGELDKIREFFSAQTIDLIISVIASIIYLFILLIYSWKVALVPIVGFLFILIISLLSKKNLRFQFLRQFDLDSANKGWVSEMISNILSIKSSAAEKKVLKRFEETALANIIAQRNISSIQGFKNASVTFTTQAIKIVGIWLATLLAFNQELSMGEIFAISLYLNLMLGPLNQIVEFLVNLQEIQIAFKKVDETVSQSELEISNNKYNAILKGLIKFEHVYYSYDGTDRKWVLKDINFIIYPRQVVAIVGKSGCGKTTLANLISGLLEPTQGKIYYDHYDQNFLTKASLQTQIGFIQQKNQLFSGSIESNISYSYSYTDPQNLDFSIENSHCTEFIQNFPTGHQQYLAEGGMGLSGGQKQRLSVARTIYQNPKILLLDEATAALDSESETALIDKLKHISSDKTTIIIAHRLSTIKHADIIFVMDEGRIVDKGTHLSLLENSKIYRDLFRAQLD